MDQINPLDNYISVHSQIGKLKSGQIYELMYQDIFGNFVTYEKYAEMNFDKSDKKSSSHNNT